MCELHKTDKWEGVWCVPHLQRHGVLSARPHRDSAGAQDDSAGHHCERATVCRCSLQAHGSVLTQDDHKRRRMSHQRCTGRLQWRFDTNLPWTECCQGVGGGGIQSAEQFALHSVVCTLTSDAFACRGAAQSHHQNLVLRCWS